MLFLCEIPSVVGWRAVTRLQCFDPWLDLLSWIPLAGAGTRHRGLSSASAKHSSHGLECFAPSPHGLLTCWEWSLVMNDLKMPWSGVRKRLNTPFLLSFQTPHIILYASQSGLALCPIWIFHLCEKRQAKQSKKNPQSNIVTFISKYLWMLIFSLYS